jgi:uncharacterized hydrophobic protein (TIGR00271 family)
LRVYAPPERAAAVRARLGPLPGVRHLVVGGQTFGGMVELTGDIDSDAADVVLDVLREFDLGAEDVTLWRASSVQPLGWPRRKGRAGGNTEAWTEVIGRANESARPGLVYLLYMAAAGVVAGVGVLNDSSILVVGAMALSPDLYPICATAIGLVERRTALWSLALFTLVTGLAVVATAAAASTAVLRVFDRISPDLDLDNTVLGQSLTVVGAGTVIVALAAGMAGMLAYETAGSAAVGVAISVTTIPAAAYIGDAIALQGYQHAAGGVTVLTTNLAGIVTAGAATIYIQRRWRRRVS